MHKILLTVVSACIILLTGCDIKNLDDKASASLQANLVLEPGTTENVCTEERKGGSIKFGVLSESSGMDPTVAAGSGAAGGIEMAAFYDTLMILDQETGKYVPHVADSVTANEDFTKWHMKLRPNIKFGNGDPLTTTAVRDSMKRYTASNKEPIQRNASGAWVQWIEEYEIINDLEMIFHLDRAWGTFEYALADESGMIVNTKVVEERGGAIGFNRNPAGGGVGPYEFVQYAPGEVLELKAKDDYWGGPVCIEKLRFVRITGGRSTYEAWKHGDLDVAFLRDSLTISEAEENGDTNTITFLKDLGGLLLMNNGIGGTDPPTKDLRVRKAIAYALDAHILDERSNEGAGLPKRSLLHPQSRFYNDELFLEIPHDPEKARELVEEVKAETGWDGSIRLICESAPALEDLALNIEGFLEAVGFEVELDTDETLNDVIIEVIINKDYDLACWGWSFSDTEAFIPLLQNTCNASNNRTGYCNKDMDAAIVQLREANTSEEIASALHQISIIWIETVPSFSYRAEEEVFIFKENVKGVVPSQASVIQFYDAYLED